MPTRFLYDSTGAGLVFAQDGGGVITTSPNLTGLPVYFDEDKTLVCTDLAADASGAVPLTAGRTDSRGRFNFYGPPDFRGILYVDTGEARPYGALSASALNDALSGLAAVDQLATRVAAAEAAAAAALAAASSGTDGLEGTPTPGGMAWSIPFSRYGVGADGIPYKVDTGVPAVDRRLPVPQADGSVLLWAPRAVNGPAPDITPPVIAAPTVSGITQTSAGVQFTTNESTNIVLEYGTTTSYGTLAPPSGPGTSHTLQLTNLAPGTLYHYRIRATDLSGNVTLDSDRTFTTTAAATAPLTLAAYNPSNTFEWTGPQLFASDLAADAYVEADLVGVTNADRNGAAVFRHSDSTHYIRAYFSNTEWSVDAYNGGQIVDVTRAWGGTGGGTGTARWEMVGQTISFYFRGVKIGTVDVGGTAAGLPGRRTGLSVYQTTANAVTMANAKSGSLTDAVTPLPDGGTPPTPGTAGAAAVAFWGPTRSGLFAHTGIWPGGGPSFTTARIEAAGASLGHLMDYAVVFAGHGAANWNDITNIGWIINKDSGAYARFPGKLLLGLALCPQGDQEAWDSIISGQRDGIWQSVAQQLVANNWGDTAIRVGWEANGNWYPWRVRTSTAAKYKQAFQRVVNVMRAVGPNLKFGFDQAAASELLGRTENAANRTQELTLLYPGSAHVDFISVDVYDFAQLRSRTQAEWNNALRPPYRAGLADYFDFAVAQNKPFGIPEWGVHKDGYGDNPFYMSKMWEFMTRSDVAPRLAFSSYFSEQSAYIANEIYSAGAGDQVSTVRNPQSRAYYVSHWGEAEAVDGWYAHGAAPAMPLDTAKSYAFANYQQFKALCFTQSGMPSGMPAGAWRVRRPDQNNDSVSEGIAYGMLCTAVYGNPALGAQYDSSARGVFDGLWRYYNHFKNPNGVMSYLISSSGTVQGAGGATDGDLDAAMALILAHRLWGSAGSINYSAAANTLLTAILNTEFTPAGYMNGATPQGNIMKNGDASPWTNADQRIDPDYLRFAWFREFAKHTGNTRWNDIVTANYPLWNYFDSNFSTGLVPNESNRNGTDSNTLPGGLPSNQFGYNSVRLSLNATVDYLWNGPGVVPAVAYSQSNKLAVWAKGQVGGGAFPGNLGSVYAMNGTGKQQGPTQAFMQAYGGAALIDDDHSAFAAQVLTWLYTNRMAGDYFGTSLNAVMSMFMAGLCKPNP